MAIPFQPLTTNQLKSYFKRMVDQNCHTSEINKCRDKSGRQYTGNNPSCPGKILETWIQRQINHKIH